MPNLAISRISDPARNKSSLFEEFERNFAEVQRMAFDLFERRGRGPGQELDDWFRAERELFSWPPSELAETGKEFVMEIAVPGMDQKQIHITATPQTILVQAEAAHKHDRKDHHVHFCEFSENRLTRRFDLDSEIDVDKVSAQLENGILRIDAPKAAKKDEKQAQPASSRVKVAAGAAS
jgi:HSP20 family protein